MNIKLFVSLFLFLLSGFLQAQFYEVPGVRNSSMGEVGAASTNDASATFWNPALLADLYQLEISSDSRKYFWELDNDELLYNYAAIAFPLGNIGTFAFSGSQFDANIYQERKLGLHIGKSLWQNKLSIGASGHYLNLNYGQNEFTVNDPFFEEFGHSSDAFDFDVGIAYRLLNNLQFGFTAKNILEANLALDKRNDENLSRDYSLGVEYRTNNTFTTAFDVTFITNNALKENEFKFAGGTEYRLNNFLDLRSGISNQKATCGFGINALNKEYLSTFIDPFTTEEYINIKSFQLEVNYSFQYQFSGINTEYGEHFIGLEIKFSNSTDKVNKLSEFVPPNKVYVTEVEIDSLDNENVAIDTMKYFSKVIVDTVYIEKTIPDTVVIFSGIPDSTYISKVKELNALKIKFDHAKNSNQAQIHLLHSLEKYYQGLYSEAIKECESAIAVAPDITLSYIRLGSIYLKINDIEKAKYYWQKAKQMDPNDPEVIKIDRYLN